MSSVIASQTIFKLNKKGEGKKKCLAEHRGVKKYGEKSPRFYLGTPKGKCLVKLQPNHFDVEQFHNTQPAALPLQPSRASLNSVWFHFSCFTLKAFFFFLSRMHANPTASRELKC